MQALSEITKRQKREKSSEEMVCTTPEPFEAEGKAGNAILLIRPIAVLAVCANQLLAVGSYLAYGHESGTDLDFTTHYNWSV